MSRACLDSAARTAINQEGSGCCSFLGLASELSPASHRTTIRVGFMKFLCAFLAISSSFIFAGDNQSVTDARRQLDNVRQQVAAGLLPSAKIADAQRALDDATDQAVLEETLYGHLDIQDLTEAQAGEMLAAAQRRVTRAQADVDRGTELISQGVAPRGFNTENLAELDRRKQALQQAENRAELLSEVAAV